MDDSSATNVKTSAKHVPASDGAWKVHETQSSWIEKADVKASIILTLETAILGLVTVLSTDGHVLAGLYGFRRTVDFAAMALLLLSTLFSLSAIIPQLGRRENVNNDPGIIYFGDLRHWSPDALAGELQLGRPSGSDVAEQIVILARISWCKHQRLRRSMILFTLGALFLMAAITWPVSVSTTLHPQLVLTEVARW